MNELYTKLGFDGILNNISSLQSEVASLKAASSAKEKEAIEQAHKAELAQSRESASAAGVLGFYAGAAIAVAGFIFVKVQKEKEAAAYAAHKEKEAAAYAAHKEQEATEAKAAIGRAEAKYKAESEQAKRAAREAAEEAVQDLERQARRIEVEQRLAQLRGNEGFKSHGPIDTKG